MKLPLKAEERIELKILRRQINEKRIADMLKIIMISDFKQGIDFIKINLSSLIPDAKESISMEQMIRLATIDLFKDDLKKFIGLEMHTVRRN